MDGLQFVGELVGVHRPSDEALNEAAIKGQGAPPWNVTIEARKPNGEMMQLRAMFQAADRSGQPTPLLKTLLELFGEPCAVTEWRPSGQRVRAACSVGVSKFGKAWYSVSRVESVEAEAKPLNGKAATEAHKG